MKKNLSKTANWLLGHALTVGSCVLIIALGIVLLASSSPGTPTIIGEGITTGDLTADTLTDGTFSVTGGVVTGASGKISMWTNDIGYLISETDPLSIHSPANPSQGDILYYDNTTGWTKLNAGTPGHFLQTQASPQWASIAASETDPLSIHKDGSVDLTGDWTISTNNITLTAGILQAATLTDSIATLTSGNLTGAGNIGYSGTLTQAAAGGQNTFTGNVAAQNGLDVTNADLTVGGANFVVDDATGNVTLVANATLDGLDVSDLSTTNLNEGASLIGINDAGGYYASADVEAALQEIATGGTIVHSLDDAYNDGTTIAVDAYDLLFNLSNDVPGWKVIIDNVTTGVIDDALEVRTGGVGATFINGLDVSDAGITNAINIGANAIAGTNFFVTGAGAATVASLDASSGGITNAGAISGATTITASGLIQSTAGNIQGASGIFSTDVQTPALTANTAVNNNIAIDAAGSGNIIIGEGGGNVGIGTASPQYKTDFVSANNSYNTVGAATLAVGEWTGIHFGYRENNTNYRKSAIVFERTGPTIPKGKIHFLNDISVLDSGSAELSDAKMTISDNGNVGIGVTNPVGKLHVAGACFLAGTKITFSDGKEENIEEIKVGDRVKSYDLIKKEIVYSRVSNIKKRKSDHYYLISIPGNKEIQVTEEHPFYVDGQWIKVKNLKKGMELFNGSEPVKIISIKRINIPVNVYNLEVAQSHNYFAQGVLVHNKSGYAGIITDTGVGIGDTTPGGILDVSHDSGTSTDLYVDGSTGEVGIGTDNPGAELDVYDGYATISRDGVTNLYEGQLTIREITHPGWPGRMSLGYNEADDKGFIQVGTPEPANYPLLLNPSGGSVGIGTDNPQTKLDVNGDFALRRADITLSNGSNNDISVGGKSFAKITGPDAAFTITGIAGGQDGKVLILFNATIQNMTIANLSASSAAANRIVTMTGADRATTEDGTVTLIYDSDASKWLVTSFEP